MKKIVSGIFSFLFAGIITALIFVIYKEFLMLFPSNSASNTSIDHQQILNEYAEKYIEAINNYYLKYNVVPNYSDIKQNIDYYKNNVSCNINVIYKDRSIYLNDCTINDKATNLNYGKRQAEIDKSGIMKNEYFIDYDFLYVKNVDSFKALSDSDVRNIIYTIVNSGVDSFSFTCHYDGCIDYIKELLEEDYSLSYVNYFVHPFNSYENIKIQYNNFNKVTVTVTKRYTEDEISYVDKKIDEIIDDIIKNNMSNKEKIRALHDYIINNSKYVTDEIKNKYPDTSFSKASDILSLNYGLCMSYTDFLAIALDKLNIKNYQISSSTHVWNLVYLDGEWLHLDATWDDPVSPTREDYLEYTYFLITDQKLKSLNVKEHDYDKNIVLELKDATN